MPLALTRAVPPSIDRCELTHLQREPIDYARAVVQHEAYEGALRRLGCTVHRLPDAPDMPDSVFVEDTAIVFDEIAVIARPGAASRRREVESVAEALRPHRRLVYIQPPGVLDGGDVLVTPGRVFVGMTGRTSADGARQLATHLAPFGFEVIPVPVTQCLHLKTAVTLVALPAEAGSHTTRGAPEAERHTTRGALEAERHTTSGGPEAGSHTTRGGPEAGSHTTGGGAVKSPSASSGKFISREISWLPPSGGRAILLINPVLVDPKYFDGHDLIEVDPAEPLAANVLRIGDRLICAEEHPNTRRRLEAEGFVTVSVPAAELAKAEGGVTCCCVLVALH